MYLFLLLAGGIVAALTGRVFDRIAGFRQIAASVREWSQSTGRSPWIGYSAGACFAVGWLLLGVAIVGMYLSRFQQKPAPALFSMITSILLSPQLIRGLFESGLSVSPEPVTRSGISFFGTVRSLRRVGMARLLLVILMQIGLWEMVGLWPVARAV